MVEDWSRFALRFSDYYKSLDHNSLWVPPRLRSREWMFIPWGSKPPDRHRGFIDKKGLLRNMFGHFEIDFTNNDKMFKNDDNLLNNLLKHID